MVSNSKSIFSLDYLKPSYTNKTKDFTAFMLKCVLSWRLFYAITSICISLTRKSCLSEVKNFSQLETTANESWSASGVLRLYCDFKNAPFLAISKSISIVVKNYLNT